MVSQVPQQEGQLSSSPPHLTQEILFHHPLTTHPTIQPKQTRPAFLSETHLFPTRSERTYTDNISVEQPWERNLHEEEEEDEDEYGPDMDADGIAEMREFIQSVTDWIDDVNLASAEEKRDVSGEEENEIRGRFEECMFEKWRRERGDGMKGERGGGMEELMREEGVEGMERRWLGLVQDRMFGLEAGGGELDLCLEDEEDSDLSFLERLRLFEACQTIREQRDNIEKEVFFDAVEEMVNDDQVYCGGENFGCGETWVRDGLEEQWIEDYKNLKEEDFEVKVIDGWENEDEDYDEDAEQLLETTEVWGAMAVGAIVLWVL